MVRSVQKNFRPVLFHRLYFCVISILVLSSANFLCPDIIVCNTKLNVIVSGQRQRVQDHFHSFQHVHIFIHLNAACEFVRFIKGVFFPVCIHFFLEVILICCRGWRSCVATCLVWKETQGPAAAVKLWSVPHLSSSAAPSCMSRLYSLRCSRVSCCLLSVHFRSSGLHIDCCQ